MKLDKEEKRFELNVGLAYIDYFIVLYVFPLITAFQSTQAAYV